MLDKIVKVMRSLSRIGNNICTHLNFTAFKCDEDCSNKLDSDPAFCAFPSGYNHLFIHRGGNNQTECTASGFDLRSD